MSLTAEQRHYLAEGIRHRTRHEGGGHDRGEGYELTLALAWFAAWHKDAADRREVRNADRVTPDMFAGDG